MKPKPILPILCLVIIFTSTLTGAFSLFTTHRSQTLRATTGVSIQFEEDERILERTVSSAEPTDFLLKKDSPESWWCKKGTPVLIDASIKDGYIFEGWYHNQEKIADTLQANYIVEGYTLLSAHLTPIDEPEEPSNATAFAVYSSDDHSLSFYKRSKLPNLGDLYYDKTVTAIYPDIENLEISNYKDVPWFNDYAEKIKMVHVVDTIRPNTLAFWFFFMYDCDTFHLEKLDTSMVTSMDYTFSCVAEDASSFVLDLNHWDTSNVQSMASMFEEAAVNADTFHLSLSTWNTSNVADMSNMFNEAGRYASTWIVDDLSTKVIASPDAPSYLAWDVSNVKNMKALFSCVGEGADEFVLDVHNWNISSVQDLSSMFGAFRRGKSGAIIHLDVSTKPITLENGTTYIAWDLSGYHGSLYYMFAYAGRSANTFSVDLSTWDVSNVTSMKWMFYYTGQNTANFYLGDLSNWNTGNVTSMDSMFKYAGQKADYTLDLSSWDVSKVTAYGGFATGTGSHIVLPNF
ncbi:MAG: BspA family leucine-rich repeat surface protein [Lachnospiraceae bacterium]|nr:BspA family leucine-rich repeat surface protein [Lachnospiraceae bacterium]